MKQKIEEKDNPQEEWYKTARDMQPANVGEFVRHLTEDYEHDYGTICHAAAAAACAAARAVDHSDVGGITGFQAGAISWEFVHNWGAPTYDEDIGARFLDLGLMLYPQYEDAFRVIRPETWKALQKKAQQQLDNVDMRNGAERVRAHWQSIVDGVVPFGMAVSQESETSEASVSPSPSATLNEVDEV